MNKLVSILLIAAFSASTVTRVFTIVDFKINQDYIAKVLCINKDKPTSTCNGKCHLSKQLKKQANEEDKQLPQNSKEKVETLFSESISINITPNFILNAKRASSFEYDGFNTSNYLTDVFHPPQTS